MVTFDEEYGEAQIRLLQAAKEAGVKRFAPSEFAMKVRLRLFWCWMRHTDNLNSMICVDE